jgi:hypothetical protein
MVPIKRAVRRSLARARDGDPRRSARADSEAVSGRSAHAGSADAVSMDDRTFRERPGAFPRIEEVERAMPIVFVFIAVLFWATIMTVVLLARLCMNTLRWVVSLGHGPRGSRRPPIVR